MPRTHGSAAAARAAALAAAVIFANSASADLEDLSAPPEAPVVAAKMEDLSAPPAAPLVAKVEDYDFSNPE